MSERERAEALVKRLMESEPDTFVGHVLTFAREERASVWEEAKGLLEAQQCRNPFYGTARFKGEIIKFAEWIDKVAIMFGQFAKQLREEGRG